MGDSVFPGDTPLIDAARHGRAADVAALLANGAAVNAWTMDGATALHVACGGHGAARCER